MHKFDSPVHSDFDSLSDTVSERNRLTETETHRGCQEGCGARQAPAGASSTSGLLRTK